MFVFHIIRFSFFMQKFTKLRVAFLTRSAVLHRFLLVVYICCCVHWMCGTHNELSFYVVHNFICIKYIDIANIVIESVTYSLCIQATKIINLLWLCHTQ